LPLQCLCNISLCVAVDRLRCLSCTHKCIVVGEGSSNSQLEREREYCTMYILHWTGVLLYYQRDGFSFLYFVKVIGTRTTEMLRTCPDREFLGLVARYCCCTTKLRRDLIRSEGEILLSSTAMSFLAFSRTEYIDARNGAVVHHDIYTNKLHCYLSLSRFNCEKPLKY
jgi:hypothetical protein